MPREVETPMPVIVGAARSGTTLLRLMLDSHPELVIPPETGFLPVLAEMKGRPVSVDELVDAMVDFETWPDFGLGRDELKAAVVSGDATEAARAFYRLYAARHGKPH